MAESLTAILRKSLGFVGRIRLVQSRTRLPDSRAGKYEDFICKIDAGAA